MQNIIRRETIDFKEIARIQFIIGQIDYPDYTFILRSKENDQYSIAIKYMEPDVYSGVDEVQEGREWIFPAGQTTGQIVQTCFKAILTSLEHRAREHFKYRGKSVLMPHLDIDKVWEMLP